MKRIIIAIVIVLVAYSCAASKNYKMLSKQQEILIEKYEILLDSMYKDEPDMFLDVWYETDEYLDYTIERDKYLKMKEEMK